jgi:type I restriction enzyme, S subunit
VAKIERLVGKVEKARRIRVRNDISTNKIMHRVLAETIGQLKEKHGTVSIEEIIINAGYGTSKKCFSDRLDGSIPILRIPNVISENISFTNLKYADLSGKELEKVGLRVGDLLIVRTNGSADLVGRCAVVKTLNEPSGFASYLIRIQQDKKKIESDYLQRCLWHMRISGQLFDLARTTAGQYNVSLGRIRTGRIPLPPLEEQNSIVKHLDSLLAKVDDLKALQAKTAAALDAMFPSILDMAFKGEL